MAAFPHSRCPLDQGSGAGIHKGVALKNSETEVLPDRVPPEGTGHQDAGLVYPRGVQAQTSSTVED
eukprot:3873208-Pyramimonas_sp.AAC.1